MNLMSTTTDEFLLRPLIDNALSTRNFERVRELTSNGLSTAISQDYSILLPDLKFIGLVVLKKSPPCFICGRNHEFTFSYYRRAIGSTCLRKLPTSRFRPRAPKPLYLLVEKWLRSSNRTVYDNRYGKSVHVAVSDFWDLAISTYGYPTSDGVLDRDRVYQLKLDDQQIVGDIDVFLTYRAELTSYLIARISQLDQPRGLLDIYFT